MHSLTSFLDFQILKLIYFQKNFQEGARQSQGGGRMLPPAPPERNPAHDSHFKVHVIKIKLNCIIILVKYINATWLFMTSFFFGYESKCKSSWKTDMMSDPVSVDTSTIHGSLNRFSGTEERRQLSQQPVYSD